MSETAMLFILLFGLISFLGGTYIRSKRNYHMPLALFNTPKKNAKKKKSRKEMDKHRIELEA